MTAPIQSTDTVADLIHSCQQACSGFRMAAEATGDESLKRLFTIYAHQRMRFAQELTPYGGECPSGEEFIDSNAEWMGLTGGSDDELIRQCLEADEQSLTAYRRAMAAQISSRAHFLISAQYSLLQRGHERISGLLQPAQVLNQAAHGSFQVRCAV